MQISVPIFVLMVLWSVEFRAQSIEDPRYARIINYEYANSDQKKYYFKYKTSNGIFREEYGEIVLINNEEIIVVRGRYSYVGDDDVLYTVKYVADDKGYRIEKDQATEARPPIQYSPIVPVPSISSNGIKTLQGGNSIPQYSPIVPVPSISSNAMKTLQGGNSIG